MLCKLLLVLVSEHIDLVPCILLHILSQLFVILHHHLHGLLELVGLLFLVVEIDLLILLKLLDDLLVME